MCCQDGRDGLPGLTGRDGPPGLTGRDGLNGHDGLNGQDGLPGLTGRDGPKGEPGQEGLRGERGLAGSKGEQGPAGLQGLAGAEGSKGEPGQEGLKGEPGLAGSKGEQGPAGLQGLTGAEGSKGEPGQEGLKGEPGLAGSNGEQGPAGLQGLAGAEGSKGELGSKGENGSQGLQGLQGLPGAPAPTTGGDTYVRWGRTICPSITGTTLVYSGWAAGSHWSHSGSGANYVCLTTTPQYLPYSSATENHGLLHGAEYEAFTNQAYHGKHNHDVPCVVCHVQQRSVLMIPGQYTCPAGWTREYYGYLVTERYLNHRSTYECMDRYPETINGGQNNEHGALFYHVEARCGSLACPPYEQTKELTCAVCSK